MRVVQRTRSIRTMIVAWESWSAIRVGERKQDLLVFVSVLRSKCVVKLGASIDWIEPA